MNKENKNNIKPIPIRTHRILPFSDLSEDDFERLLFWIVEGYGEFDSVVHYGGVGDKCRDIIAYKHLKNGEKEKWYFSAKRYQKFSNTHVKLEIDELFKHAQNSPDFTPDTIVFGVSCSVSPHTRDFASKYGKENGFNHVIIWSKSELDEKTRATPNAIENFFYDNSEAIAKKVHELLKQNQSEDTRLVPLSRQVISSSPDETQERSDAVNRRIDETVALLNLNKVSEARHSLFEILGEIKDKGEFKEELVRIYNNLGVTFNRPQPEGDFEKAIYYFNLALENKPTFIKAKMNLASAYLNKDTAEDMKKGRELIQVLWSMEKTSDILQILLWALYKSGFTEEALNFIESEDPTIQELINTSAGMLNLISAIYLEDKKTQKALGFVDKALAISPNEPEFLVMKARVLAIRAQTNNLIPSDFDIIPKFNDYEDVEEALNLFKKAKKIAEKQNKDYLLPDINYGIVTSLTWLGRYEEAAHGLELLKSESLPEVFRAQVEIMTFAQHLHHRDFELAYNTLKESKNYCHINYLEKRRLARILLYRGAPEQSRLLFNEIETEAEANKDFFYWLDVSLVNIFLEEKELAIHAVTKAKEYSEKKHLRLEDKKMILSHFNTVMLRYTKRGRDGKDSETGRLVTGLDEYQKEFPEDNLVTSVKALDENGKLTQEIKDFLLAKKKSYEHTKSIFKTQPIPTYFLERVYNRAYADLVTNREDPDFTFEFSNPNIMDELNANFKNAKGFIFDYLSLLDFSKMNLLGFLEKLNKPLFIHESLFDKIQKELLQNEIEELRRLWNFLRTNKSIIFINEKSDIPIKSEKLDDLFDDWLIETIKFTRAEEYTLITDDLRLLRFARSEDIRSVNIMAFLNLWLENKYIDQRMYSRAIGDLAERFYIFIPFSGDDLFETVMEDNGQITLRSYHLINQIFLPGSIIESFTEAFLAFIQKLWKTGSLPHEKVQWIKFLTNIIIRIIDKVVSFEDYEQSPIEHLGFMWSSAIESGTKDDLIELQKIVDASLNRDFLASARKIIKEKIEYKFRKINKS